MGLGLGTFYFGESSSPPLAAPPLEALWPSWAGAFEPALIWLSMGLCLGVCHRVARHLGRLVLSCFVFCGLFFLLPESWNQADILLIKTSFTLSLAYFLTHRTERVLRYGMLAVTLSLLGGYFLFYGPATMIEPIHADAENAMAVFARGLLGGSVLSCLFFLYVVAHVTQKNNFFLDKITKADRTIANLERYVAPNIAHNRQLTRDGAIIRRNVVALFADIRGFSSLAEGADPEQTMLLLRRFHRIAEPVLRRHDGVLEKYIGDAVLVLFGMHETGRRDCTHALRAATELVREIRLWRDHAESGDQEISVGIGLHYGPVAIGDIGTETNASFAAIGDTTNIAARLQTFARDVANLILFSQDFIENLALEHFAGFHEMAAHFEDLGMVKLRGRREKIHVYGYLESIARTKLYL